MESCEHEKTIIHKNTKVCKNCCEELETMQPEDEFSSYRADHAIKYNEAKTRVFKGYMSAIQGRHCGDYPGKDFLEKFKRKLDESKKIQIKKAEKKVKEAIKKLDEAKRVSKTDMLSVLKSNFKKHRGGLHAIYSSIVGKEPLDISADECDLALDFASFLKFYTQNKEKRSVFSEKYALYYLLKQKGYALELRRDFPDIRSCVNTQKVCDDYFE